MAHTIFQAVKAVVLKDTIIHLQILLFIFIRLFEQNLNAYILGVLINW